MAPACCRLAPALLLLTLLGVPMHATPVDAAPAEAAPLLEPPIPDSARGAAPIRPERPAVVPRVVSVGDLALQDQTPAPGDAMPGPPESFQYPLAEASFEQNPWGWRFSTARGAWRMHTGLDLIAPEGTAVLAVQTGRVQRVDVIAGYGLTVLIDHGGGWSSLYAHLLNVSVGPGESVRAGQPLGAVGQSGNASTPHLHLELRRRQPEGLVAVDPSPLLAEPQDSDLRKRPASRTASTAAAMP
jgi:murein DD-endopeptidase MepM/ murein hydrolase activator NlpD